MSITLRLALFSLSFLCLFSWSARPSAAEPGSEDRPAYSLAVSFDLNEHILRGFASILLEKEKTVISVRGLRITLVQKNGRPVEFNPDAEELAIRGEGLVEIAYEASFGPGQGRDGGLRSGAVGSDGIFLLNEWYPKLDAKLKYLLHAVVPASFIAISESDTAMVGETPDRREYTFEFPYAVEQIHFAAGPFMIAKETAAGADIYSYSSPRLATQGSAQLSEARELLARMSGVLVPYPFKRLTIVQTPLASDLSAPGMLFVGSRTEERDFPAETLGTGIARQWFGGYVTAGAEGSWSDALASYIGEMLPGEDRGAGPLLRKKLMSDYQSAVTSENERALKDLGPVADHASAAIGRGKGAMVIHMLRKLLGEEALFLGVRTFLTENAFRNAEWGDLRKALEKESGKDLAGFFSEWVGRSGIPNLSVRDERALFYGGVPSVSFELNQKGEAYTLSIPVQVHDRAGDDRTSVVDARKQKEYFRLGAGAHPQKLVLDRNYDVMRKLVRDEYPAAITRLLSDDSRLIIYSDADRGKYERLIAAYVNQGFLAREENDLKDNELKRSSVLVLGYDRPVLARLFGTVDRVAGDFVLRVRENPLNTSKVVAIAEGVSADAVDRALPAIAVHRSDSFLRFENGRLADREAAESERGMIFSLEEPVEAVAPAKSFTLQQVIPLISASPAIFVGERHPNYEDHRVQFEIIRALHEQGRKVAVGMEMFQRPYQQAIDDFLKGAIDEREFLRKTEYFKRWRFDYNLYREIIGYAKANGIPIVALNLRAEIIEKVAQGGLDALSETERAEIPKDMDMANERYRSRLRDIFETHPQSSRFENFYQSQILWDETMAHSAASYLKEHPEYQIVVLAGGEHVMYRSGIPQRFKRVSGLDFSTVVTGAFDGDIANFVLYPKELTAPFSAKVGLVLKETKDEGVLADDFAPGSAAQKAGMKKGDRLLSIDEWKIENAQDARIALYDVQPGQMVKIKVLRRRFLLGAKEVELSITF